MSVGACLTFTSDGDPYERLHALAAQCEASGHTYIANMITEGAMLGLTPSDRENIASARELHVMDRVLPNGWAVLIGREHNIHDKATYWTYADDDHSVVALGGAP